MGSGGSLADVGSHRLDLLIAMLSPAHTVSAITDAVSPDDPKRVAWVQLQMLSGIPATRGMIWGSGGRLRIGALEHGQLRVSRQGDADGELKRLPPMQPTHLGLVDDFVAAVSAVLAAAYPPGSAK